MYTVTCDVFNVFLYVTCISKFCLGIVADGCLFSPCSLTQARPKLRVVEPLDYEGELITRRKDLEKEQFLNLLLFPQQDVTVSQTTALVI